MSEPEDKKEVVVGMYGGPVITGSRTPDPETIKELEELLEAARAGEIIGLVGVAMYYDEMTGSRVAGPYNKATLGALEMLKARLVQRLMDKD